jgi:hypothetical protein
MNISEFLLLEKRIAQISNSIEVTFSFDVIKTQHAEKRQDFSSRGLDVETYGYISNREMSDFVSRFKNDIAEAIALGNIVDETNFVIRSEDWQLAMAIVAKHIQGSYWQLIIKTVFRETDDFRLKVAKDQLVFEK